MATHPRSIRHGIGKLIVLSIILILTVASLHLNVAKARENYHNTEKIEQTRSSDLPDSERLTQLVKPNSNELPKISYNQVPIDNQYILDKQNPPEVSGVGGLTDVEISEGQEFAKTLPSPISYTKSSRAYNATSVRCKRYAPLNIEVCGAILDKYEQIGETTSPFLWPVEPMSINPDLRGYRLRLANGFIYWSPQTGAHVIPVQVAKVWEEHQWEQGPLGYPTSDQDAVGSNILARIQTFQHGAITQSSDLILSAIYGRIYDEWNDSGGVQGPLGFPLSNELPTPGSGRYNIFENGIITWNVSTGAHGISYEVAAIWFAKGAENELGLPLQRSILDEDDRGIVRFENGEIDLGAPDLDTRLAGTSGESLSIAMTTFNHEVARWVDNILPKPLRYRAESFRSDNRSRSRLHGREHAVIYPIYPFWKEDDFGIPVPSDYVHDTSLKPKALHDFCTSSPDVWRSVYVESHHAVLSVRGPCAIHDMCYEDSGRDNPSYRARAARVDCDHALNRNLATVSNNAIKASFGPNKIAVMIRTKIRRTVYATFVRSAHTAKHFAECPGADPDHWYFEPIKGKIDDATEILPICPW